MMVLIVGLGSIAQKHIAALRKINKDTKIYALRSTIDCNDIDGIQNIFDLTELQDFDFAIISNPSSKHIDVLQQLIIFKKCLIYFF